MISKLNIKLYFKIIFTRQTMFGCLNYISHQLRANRRTVRKKKYTDEWCSIVDEAVIAYHCSHMTVCATMASAAGLIICTVLYNTTVTTWAKGLRDYWVLLNVIYRPDVRMAFYRFQEWNVGCQNINVTYFTPIIDSRVTVVYISWFTCTKSGSTATDDTTKVLYSAWKTYL